jgi:hypothetical protein
MNPFFTNIKKQYTVSKAFKNNYSEYEFELHPESTGIVAHCFKSGTQLSVRRFIHLTPQKSTNKADDADV